MPNWHPLSVHFPLAIPTFSALFDLGGILFMRDELNRLGWRCLLAGVAGLLVTVATGLLAEGTVRISATALKN